MEHAYALSYPNAETASRTELALCRIAAKEFALRIVEKAGISLKFQESLCYLQKEFQECS